MNDEDELYKIYIPQIDRFYTFNKKFLKTGFVNVMNFFLLQIPENNKYQRFRLKGNEIMLDYPFAR